MSARAVLSAFLSAGLALAAAAPASASERDRRFFEGVEGEWAGPGEVIAGSERGTRFHCTLTGASAQEKIGMSLDGRCRVGMFSQRVNATVEHNGRQGYRGTILDGAAGDGLDVVSGSVGDRRVTFELNRERLTGAMLASFPDDDTMHVTVSVRVEDQWVPFIGLNLKRSQRAAMAPFADR